MKKSLSLPEARITFFRSKLRSRKSSTRRERLVWSMAAPFHSGARNRLLLFLLFRPCALGERRNDRGRGRVADGFRLEQRRFVERLEARRPLGFRRAAH